jgi:hypothetical protein
MSWPLGREQVSDLAGDDEPDLFADVHGLAEPLQEVGDQHHPGHKATPVGSVICSSCRKIRSLRRSTAASMTRQLLGGGDVMVAEAGQGGGHDPSDPAAHLEQRSLPSARSSRSVSSGMALAALTPGSPMRPGVH